jgi:DNA-directed RNA polymerase subunit beta
MELKAFLKDIYDDSHRQQMIDGMDHNELSQIIFKLKDGVPIASSAFDGATEIDMQKMIAKAGLPPDGYFALRDGQTGDYFERKVMVGRQYIMKLYHLVSDKIHARAIGPYGAITQQPLKGRGKFGGQRLGEMEIWAIEAYGAAYNLLEMMTIKSDDVNGRNEAFESICTTGQYHMKEFGTMETTDVLLHELRGLALDIEKISREDADKEHARKKSINTKESKKGKKTNSLKKTKILLKDRLMKEWN